MEYPIGPVKELIRCPGLYCGRERENGSWSECKACPRGYRVNSSTSECVRCQDTPLFYDWLYLGFMAMLALVLHWFCIDFAAKRRSFTYGVLIVHLSALIEVASAAILTLLLAEPFGEFGIRSCRVQNLSDWYTLLHNPSPGYVNTLHCTQEAVYPLYTVVFIFYALCLVFMLILRPFLVSRFLPTRGKASIYAALYFLPILVVLQAIFGGLLYYSYPYIIIIVSIISNAAHFAFKLDQSITSLLVSTVMDVRNVVILLGHWVLHAYGIIAVTQLKDPVLHGALIAVVPFPAIFYVLTSKFTDPDKLHYD